MMACWILFTAFCSVLFIFVYSKIFPQSVIGNGDSTAWRAVSAGEQSSDVAIVSESQSERGLRRALVATGKKVCRHITACDWAEIGATMARSHSPDDLFFCEAVARISSGTCLPFLPNRTNRRVRGVARHLKSIAAAPVALARLHFPNISYRLFRRSRPSRGATSHHITLDAAIHHIPCPSFPLTHSFPLSLPPSLYLVTVLRASNVVVVAQPCSFFSTRL